jgi:hypothetical protein
LTSNAPGAHMAVDGDASVALQPDTNKYRLVNVQVLSLFYSTVSQTTPNISYFSVNYGNIVDIFKNRKWCHRLTVFSI